MGTILIVEDNEIICDCLKNIVKSVDDSQAVFGTGYAAIAKANIQVLVQQELKYFCTTQIEVRFV